MSLEITRKTETIVETKRQFIISAAKSSEQIFCQSCAGLMISAELCAAVFGVSRRTIYRQIELEPNAHFVEAESGIVFVCPNSFAPIAAKETF